MTKCAPHKAPTLNMRGKFTFDGRVVLHRLAEPVKKEEEKLGKYLGLRFRGGPGADIVRREPQPAAWERVLSRLCAGVAGEGLLETTGCEPPHHVCPSLSLSTSG